MVADLEASKAALFFTLESATGRVEGLSEELADAKAELRDRDDLIRELQRVHSLNATTSTAATSAAAEAAAPVATTSQTASSEQGSPADGTESIVAQVNVLKQANERLVAELTELRLQLAAATTAPAATPPVSAAGVASATTTADGSDGEEEEGGMSARVAKLEAQVRTLTKLKQEAEEAEENAQKERRTAEREGRNKDRKIQQLETDLASAQKAYERQRERMKRSGRSDGSTEA